MKLVRFFLVPLLMVLLGCASTQKNDKFVQMSSVDLGRLELALKLRSLAADQVWPGFDKFFPSVVYFTSESQFLFNPTARPPKRIHFVIPKGSHLGTEGLSS